MMYDGVMDYIIIALLISEHYAPMNMLCGAFNNHFNKNSHTKIVSETANEPTYIYIAGIPLSR